MCARIYMYCSIGIIECLPMVQENGVPSQVESYQRLKKYTQDISSCILFVAHFISYSEPFSPPLSIVHRFRQVFRATSCIGTERLYVGSSWLSCLCSSMWQAPQKYVTYEFVLTSPAVSRNFLFYSGNKICCCSCVHFIWGNDIQPTTISSTVF